MLEQAFHILENEQVMNSLKNNIQKLAKANATKNINILFILNINSKLFFIAVFREAYIYINKFMML